MLEDGLTMIAAHVLKDEKVCNLLKKKFKNLGNVEIDRLTEKTRDELRKGTQTAFDGENMKIVVTVMRESSIWNQLADLEKYPCDIAVCKAVKMRKRKIA
jgi:ASC-1-like (ASCH) protein